MCSEACDQVQDRSFTGHVVRWLRIRSCKPKRNVEQPKQGNVPENGRVECERCAPASEDIGTSVIHDGGFEVEDAPGARLMADPSPVVHLSRIHAYEVARPRLDLSPPAPRGVSARIHDAHAVLI